MQPTKTITIQEIRKDITEIFAEGEYQHKNTIQDYHTPNQECAGISFNVEEHKFECEDARDIPVEDFNSYSFFTNAQVFGVDWDHNGMISPDEVSIDGQESYNKTSFNALSDQVREYKTMAQFFSRDEVSSKLEFGRINTTTGTLEEVSIINNKDHNGIISGAERFTVSNPNYGAPMTAHLVTSSSVLFSHIGEFQSEKKVFEPIEEEKSLSLESPYGLPMTVWPTTTTDEYIKRNNIESIPTETEQE